MTTELIIDPAKFNTGLYHGCEFTMSGGDAKSMSVLFQASCVWAQFPASTMASIHGFAELQRGDG